LAIGNGPCGPLHGLTFALLHLACMQMLSVVVPPALAVTAQGIYGGVAVGTMTAIMTLVSGLPLRRARPARVLGHGAALRRRVADRVRDAQDLNQSIGVESDPSGDLIVGRVHGGPLPSTSNQVIVPECYGPTHPPLL
jgi:hypothetical protein